jgi:hypothetical protein
LFLVTSGIFVEPHVRMSIEARQSTEEVPAADLPGPVPLIDGTRSSVKMLETTELILQLTE